VLSFIWVVALLTFNPLLEEGNHFLTLWGFFSARRGSFLASAEVQTLIFFLLPAERDQMNVPARSLRKSAPVEPRRTTFPRKWMVAPSLLTMASGQIPSMSGLDAFDTLGEEFPLGKHKTPFSGHSFLQRN